MTPNDPVTQSGNPANPPRFIYWNQSRTSFTSLLDSPWRHVTSMTCQTFILGNSKIRCRRSPTEPSVISSLDLECFMIRVWLDRKPLILTMMVQMFVRVIRFIRFLKKFWDISEKDKKKDQVDRKVLIYQ